MAFWLYCKKCKQWTKSATSLSDGSKCSFCNEILSNGISSEKIAALKKDEEYSRSGPKVIPITSESSEDPEMPARLELSDGREASEADETVQEQEISIVNQTIDIPEEPAAEVAEEPETLELPETLEEQETPAPETHEIAAATTIKTPLNRNRRLKRGKRR